MKTNPSIKLFLSFPVCASLTFGLAGFALYFYYAQFVGSLGWNAIELLIAQHLIDHGQYATSVDYPSALPWRPVFPVLLVTALRLISDDPLWIYRVFCGLTIGTLAATMFLGARMLCGAAAGCIAGFLILACPAVTIYPIHHIHSFSHLGALLVLGPALLLALRLLYADRLKTGDCMFSGALWGLACLCRPELILFAMVHLAALGFRLAKEKRSWTPIAACALGIAAFVVPYNIAADRVAKRDGLLIRKPVYTFYLSQGWVDPPAGIGTDVEGEGYVYATKLYGNPSVNGESMIAAIRKNPGAFRRRVALNLREFYRRFRDNDFFTRTYARATLAGLAIFIFVAKRFRDRLVALFLIGTFAAQHFVLPFHIDARYLTISVPPLILLMVFSISRALAAARKPYLARAAAAIAVALLVSIGYHHGLRLNKRSERNDRGFAAMRALGEHFRAATDGIPTTGNREAHIDFVQPSPSPVQPEDSLLLGYYSRTAWTTGGAEGLFPRGKFYSFRDVPPDYRYLPAEEAADPEKVRGWKIISEHKNPVFGLYVLLKPAESANWQDFQNADGVQ